MMSTSQHNTLQVPTQARGTTARRANPTPAAERISLHEVTRMYQSRKAASTVEDNGYPKEEFLNCWIDTGLHQNGYPTYSYSHTAANIQVSHLALRAVKGICPSRSCRETASHLCHRKSCIRPEHIIIETVGSNGRRNGCLAFVACDHCGERINACGHWPRCLLPFNK
jgi:hypothetical protein